MYARPQPGVETFKRAFANLIESLLPSCAEEASL
jgi:hypothetical protein